jgi:hypothetical protein
MSKDCDTVNQRTENFSKKLLCHAGTSFLWVAYVHNRLSIQNVHVFRYHLHFLLCSILLYISFILLHFLCIGILIFCLMRPNS